MGGVSESSWDEWGRIGVVNRGVIATLFNASGISLGGGVIFRYLL